MRLLSVLLAGMIVCGCTLPRIIVLNDPLDAQQHNDLGVAYEQRGEYDLAEREYRRAAELDRKWAVPLVNLGNVQASQAAWADAAVTYRQALDLKADSVEALNNLAWVLVQAGRPVEALPRAQQAVTLAAEDPRCWDTLAAVQLALGQSEAARQSALRGLALAPSPSLRTSLESKLSAR